MATGDSNDILVRVKKLLPGGWFADVAPLRDAVLGGIASAMSSVYAFILYAKLQTRLFTATAPFLDIASLDFFGTSLPRLTNESDPAFSARIRAEIVRERQTRNGIVQALTALTGRAPLIIEPANPMDTAAYGDNAYYGQVGLYGSLLLRNQLFVIAFRPLGAGIANMPGYGHAFYGAPTSGYIDQSQITGQVTDAMIYAAVARTLAAGITAWVQIVNNPPLIPTANLLLDYSQPQDAVLLTGLSG